MRTTDVNLVQMTNSSVARSDRDILQLNVHVILSYIRTCQHLIPIPLQMIFRRGGWRSVICVMTKRTFEELAAVHLAGCDLESNNMALYSIDISR